MDQPTPQSDVFISPKRKRDNMDIDSITEGSRTYVRVRTDSLPPPLPFDDDRDGNGSPRTAVSGQFSALNIHEAPSQKVPHNQPPYTHQAVQTTGGEEDTITIRHPPLALYEPRNYPFQQQTLLIPASTTDFEIPETPTGSFRMTSPPSPPLPQKSPIRIRSPPPLNISSVDPPPLFTSGPSHDPSSEGTNSADGLYDDLTGVNGIGYRPTPAVAWARAQRRKQQVAEWKKREAREARQRRSERRSGAGAVVDNRSVEEDGNAGGLGEGMEMRRRVRFVEV
ncbi:MAG: hypothetical protein MMC33_004981 [Icmadophila ericetorum]|nr:hypothetical protein [Icmadophila ericetorum]